MGVLKKRYEEGMTVTATAPKKGPPSPRAPNAGASASSAGVTNIPPSGMKKSGSPKTSAPVGAAKATGNSSQNNTSVAVPSASVEGTSNSESPSPKIASRANHEVDAPNASPAGNNDAEKPKEGDTLSNSEASASEPRTSASEASPVRPIDATKKDAMKKALEDMVLPPRKKPTTPSRPAAAGANADASNQSQNASTSSPNKNSTQSAAASGKGKENSSTKVAGSAGSAEVPSPTASSENSERQKEEEKELDQSEEGDDEERRKKKRSSSGAIGTGDTGTTGTSDDEISSDEEEYLRGVEERRLKAVAEKAERIRLAKEAREARQNMYSFLTQDPPPGFVKQAKPSAATNASSSANKSKTKKEKKDKARDKTSSKQTLTPQSAAGAGASAQVTGNSGSQASGVHDESSSGRKKGSGPAKDATHASSFAGSTANASSATEQTLNARRNSSDLDLSSSPSNSTINHFSTASQEQSDGFFATRYRPIAAIDPSTWRKAEESILKSSLTSSGGSSSSKAPQRRRWEEYQAKYAAKIQAADEIASRASKDKDGKDTPKKQYSTSNLKAGLKTNLQLKGLRTTRDRRISNGESMNDSPRKRVTNDPPEGSGFDSPRRRSNAEDSSDSTNNASGKESPLNRKPPPKLDIIDDPRVFLFEAPIGDSNLRFMERNGEELIAGGTIEKLIQILTSSSDPNPEYFQCFMLTYHNFLTPQQLIELLRLRWNSQPSDPAKLDMFVARHLHSIRLRVVNVLRMWIEKFGTDFKDEAVVEALKSFIDYIRAEYPQMADLVTSRLNKYLAGYIFDTEGDVDEDPPATHLILDGRDQNPSLTDIHPEEFARQMTLVEHALFKAIPYKELLTNASSLSSSSANGRVKLNPNVSNMISYTNHLVNWIGTQIVKHDDIKMRAVALARFITIGKYCIISCQNYNGAMEVISAIRAAPVFRLKHTWNLLPDNIWEDYEWLENIFESDNNYAAYRAALTNAVPPCVPYLGRYLSEILFLNELHPDYLDHTQKDNPVINFAKMTYVADILLHMQRYQKSPFCLTGAPSIQKFFLLKRGVLGDKDLYKLSLEREPRESSGSVSSGASSNAPSSSPPKASLASPPSEASSATS